MFDTLVRGGTVVGAAGLRRADVAILGERVAALVPPGEAAPARTVVAAEGCYLLPGLVDAHAHLREPGLTHKEDFSSGTHAAALGGVTTVLDMPTDDPWTATPDGLSGKMALAEGRLHVDVGFQVALGRGLGGLPDLLALGPVSFELFTADVPDAFLFAAMDDVAEALKRFRGADTLVGVSPGNQSILSGTGARQTTGSMAAGTVAAFLASRPPLAEAGGIARAVLAAAEAGTRIHVRQINSRLGVAAWTRLRDLADASVETTPQNLFLTADDYATRGAAIKASPPFRTRADVEALRGALSAGRIDVVATDHAPHSPAEKVAPVAFSDIPGGMPGLQTLLVLMLKLVDEGVIGLPDIARLCAETPAARFGLAARKGRIAPGLDADILVLDPRRDSLIADARQVSKAGGTPFDSWTARGRLTRVFLRGHAIVGDDTLVAPARGRVITREGRADP